MKNSNFLKENNARYQWHPMAHPGEMQENPPKIVSGGEGYEIIDIDGRRLVDGVGGLWNTNLGYSCQPIKQAMYEQLDKLPYYNTFRGTTNEPSIELSYALAEYFAPEKLTRAFYTSGGSDSVETALRLARQFHRVNGEPERTAFFSVTKGYHGTHFGGASVNGDAKFRRNYAPMLPDCHHLPTPYVYRSELDTDDASLVADHIVRSFRAEINFHGADTIAALIIEPVLGAGGVVVPHETLLPRLRALCNEHGILMITDEVITAFGRTGAECGSRLWGIAPDMACTAKGLSNGYFPMGAVMIGERMASVFETAKGGNATISHGYTYSGHPVGAAAALAALAEINRLRIWENAAVRGEQLMAGLHALQRRHELIGDVRGKGLMAAIELVSDRASKKPAAKSTVAHFYETAYEHDVMLRTSGNNVIISPCLIIDADGIDRILAAMDAGLAAATEKPAKAS